ncbi:MAG: hypothetical protein P4M13_03240 [Alphaproteobacteria bacterium]|nr:hypothetical protein [Alphaproteobacteria bacterium]
MAKISKTSFEGFCKRIINCSTVSDARDICQKLGLVAPPSPLYAGSFYHPLERDLIKAVRLRGGFSNCHGHADRAYSVIEMIMAYGPDVFERPMTEKWDMTKKLELSSTPDIYLTRILKYVFESIDSGTTYICTNIDADPSSGTRALEAAKIVRDLFERNPKTDEYYPVVFKFGPHPHEGFFTNGKLDRMKVELYEFGSKMGNFCGGLPSRDGRIGNPESEAHFDEHLNIVLQTAQAAGRNCGIHVDQANSVSEAETHRLMEKMVQYGMQGKVVGVHCVSLSRKTKSELKDTIAQMKDVQFGAIVCPTAAISMKAPNELSPTGGSLAPIQILMAEGIPCFIGGDNRADIYNPYSQGNMLTELHVARETLRSYDNDQFVRYATSAPFAFSPFGAKKLSSDSQRAAVNKRNTIEWSLRNGCNKQLTQ